MTAGMGAIGGMVGSVGRTGTTLALVDERMRLVADSIRTYTAADEPMVTGAILRRLDECGLGGAPPPLALALAGVVRDEIIPITNSRRFVSRRGLTDLLRRPPVLVNDFAALGWALAGGYGATSRALGSATAASSDAGTRCLIGVDDALGVVAFVKDGANRTTVLATEAGSSAIGRGPLAGDGLRSTGGGARVQADALLSANGLLAIYRSTCAEAGAPARLSTGFEVARAGAHRVGDTHAATAVGRFCSALLSFAADLVLIYGAWDGVYLSGRLVEALADPLAAALRAGALAAPGPHGRRLAGVPVALARFDHGELAGAAIALAHAGEADARVR